jgi:hypothetical protein
LEGDPPAHAAGLEKWGQSFVLRVTRGNRPPSPRAYGRRLGKRDGANILGASDPLPSPGSLVVLHHFTSCRSRMNEALQALGAVGKVYTDSDLTRVDLKAVHINELLEAVR